MSSYCASEFAQAKEGEAGNLRGFRCSLTQAWTNAVSKKATGILKNALKSAENCYRPMAVADAKFADEFWNARDANDDFTAGG